MDESPAPRIAPRALDVRDLVVEFPTDHGTVRALDQVSMRVEAGQRIALVGESGSGKSTLALASIGLVPPPGRIVSGEVTACGVDMVRASEQELRAARGGRVSMVFQDALGSLNPVMTIGAQLTETIETHRDLTGDAARAAAIEALREVGVPAPEVRLKQYPHEFSGGMRQRMAIAMALACRPALLIADEPTTALDVTTQAGIMELLTAVASEREMAVLFITHDLGLVAGFADHVLVMYAGVAVEYGRVGEIFGDPRHPYTRRLLNAVPRLTASRGAELPTIPGSLPSLAGPLPACRFQPRCSLSHGRLPCVEQRPELDLEDEHGAACHFSHEADDLTQASRPIVARTASREQSVLLRVDSMVKEYELRGARFRKRLRFRAVDGISFEIAEGESLGVVGESGAGKSTVARILLGLAGKADGEVTFDGRSLRFGRRRAPGWSNGGLQVVFQDPADSLNSHMTVEQIVAEPLVLARVRRDGVSRRAAEALELVGLGSEYHSRRPPQLSGGQKQRLAIARALATSPKLVICDEAVSSLDVSVRAQILNLLKRIQRELGVSYLFISHDLAVVRNVCDRVAVMYAGAIVELADVESVVRRPRHPYTRALLSAVPTPDPAAGSVGGRRIRLALDAPPPEPGVGCPFRHRCWKAQEVCATTTPPLAAESANHRAACHFPEAPEEV